MERIFKVKTKCNQDPRDLYPSERRYSASIVLGFSVVFLLLFIFSILMGTIIIHKVSLHKKQLLVNYGDEGIDFSNYSNSNSSQSYNNENYGAENVSFDTHRLEKRVEKDLLLMGDNIHYNINIPALVCGGCFVMSLGHICSAITGLFAWKRWYIDHNITFFFLSSCLSVLTSSMCFLLILLNAFNTDNNINSNYSPVGFSLTIFICILSFVGLIWSALASNVAFKGTKNCYPDDIVLAKGGGRVEVSTVRKGSKNCSVIPPDILNNFTAGNKLAKYFPKKDNSNLPKAESNSEYRQRVDKFLSSGESDSNENRF